MFLFYIYIYARTDLYISRRALRCCWDDCYCVFARALCRDAGAWTCTPPFLDTIPRFLPKARNSFFFFLLWIADEKPLRRERGNLWWWWVGATTLERSSVRFLSSLTKVLFFHGSIPVRKGKILSECWNVGENELDSNARGPKNEKCELQLSATPQRELFFFLNIKNKNFARFHQHRSRSDRINV